MVMVRFGLVGLTVLTVLPMAIAPPKNAAPATPTPPATVRAPVVVEVEAVVDEKVAAFPAKVALFPIVKLLPAFGLAVMPPAFESRNRVFPVVLKTNP